MSRLVALALALCALLAAAPAAWAATYTVDDPGDYPELVADGTCDGDPGGGQQCTLRDAIVEANATDTVDDAIVFDAAITVVAPATALPAITDRLAIDGGGDVTIETPPADSAPLLRFAAASSSLTAVALDGTAAGTATRLLSVTASGFTGSSIAFTDAPSASAELGGGSGSLTGSTVGGGASHGLILSGGGSSAANVSVSGAGGDGVILSGSGTSISNSMVAGSAGLGVVMTGGGATVSGSTVRGNAGSGIVVSNQGDTVTRTVIFGNGGRPIEVQPGANGGIQPPQSLRIGPRRADGTLPLTGNTSGGSLEVFSGNPFSALAPAYLFTHGVEAGDFTYNFASEPPPGATFALTLTGNGTSEFALVTVPDDVVSPEVAHARAVSTTEVRIVPSEPVDAASVQASDFRLFMAGQERPIGTAATAPDGSIALTSSGWKPGEAGYVEVTAPGALTDLAGNEILSANRYRVAAAPGDFVAPIATRMRLAPKAICLTRGRGCRRAGGTLSFTTSEDGRVEVVVQRGNRRVGTRSHAVKTGENRIDFDGRLRGRKLRAGRYRLLLFMTDIVGNRNPNPPITIFSVRRVTR